MPFRVYYLKDWHPISDPTEQHIAKKAVLKSLQKLYNRMSRRHGSPKALVWGIWYVFLHIPHCLQLIFVAGGYFHPSLTEPIPHWTMRGFRNNGISVTTVHVFPGGKGSCHFPNGGRYWANAWLDIASCEHL
jgi:hypothetical protein